jgi:hypothetical protein
MDDAGAGSHAFTAGEKAGTGSCAVASARFLSPEGKYTPLGKLRDAVAPRPLLRGYVLPW